MPRNVLPLPHEFPGHGGVRRLFGVTLCGCALLSATLCAIASSLPTFFCRFHIGTVALWGFVFAKWRCLLKVDTIDYVR